MCVSAETSLIMGGLLLTGGGFALSNAIKVDKTYTPMALMPIFVGIQQLMEGGVWAGLNGIFSGITEASSMAYLFFVWLIWPSWIPFMVSVLEADQKKKTLFRMMAFTGFALGLFLYLPYFGIENGLSVSVVHYSIAYQLPPAVELLSFRELVFLLYHALIGLPPLLSSHYQLRVFGIMLVLFVPITHFLFSYAYVSVLCFCAAIMTLHLIYIIMYDKCENVGKVYKSKPIH